MQKVMQTTDGKTIYVTVEPPWYIERDERYPFPHWPVIFDDTRPAKRIDEIFLAEDKQTIWLSLWDTPLDGVQLRLPLATTDFIDFLSEVHYLSVSTSEMSASDREATSQLVAELLTELWRERAEIEEAKMP